MINVKVFGWQHQHVRERQSGYGNNWKFSSFFFKKKKKVQLKINKHINITSIHVCTVNHIIFVSPLFHKKKNLCDIFHSFLNLRQRFFANVSMLQMDF